MPDIFGKETKYKSTTFVTSENLKLTVSSGGNVQEEYLVQNISLQYNQPVNRLFEIGTSNIYFAPGRPLGSFQIGRIIGKYPITAIFGNFGEGIWSTDNRQDGAGTITLSSSIGNNVNYTLSGCVVEAYALASGANDLLIQENVTGQFASLSSSG